MNIEKLVEKIKLIISSYGDSAFEEENRFYSLLGDVAPELTDERKVIRRAKDEGVLYRFFALRNIEDARIPDELNKLKFQLKTNCGFSDEWIDLLVYSFTAAFNVSSNNTSSSVPGCSSNLADKNIVLGSGELDLERSKHFESYCLDILDKKYRAMYIGAGYTMVGKSAFSNRDDIEILIIGNGISHIKKGAFKKCKNLKYIVGGNDLISIASDAFTECESLTAVYLEQGSSVSFSDIFKNPEIQVAETSFSNCRQLKVIACSGKEDVSSIKRLCSTNKIKFMDWEDMPEDSRIRQELLFSSVENINIKRALEDK